MKRILLLAFLGLAACANQNAPAGGTPPGAEAPGAAGAPPRPPANAATEEAFDTTSAEERAAAVAAPKPAGERALGTTIATLGSPADPGFWLDTPLVSSPAKGRVVAANGKSVAVDLRPIEGPKTAGSRISLPALRLLDVGLTGLHEVTVHAQ